MTNSIPLFEAKAHFSDIVRRVAEDGQEVLITVRGTPMVRIVPAVGTRAEDAWEVRERVVRAYGAPGFEPPPREVEVPVNPFGAEQQP
jgi:prevent-host-death family protein